MNLSAAIEELTPPQQEAVRHVQGPLLVLAGPGSGKTRVITHRVAHLLGEGIPAREILALTFTNKAADEMHNRIAELTGGEHVWVSTFHKFGARLLREYAACVGLQSNFTIYDQRDSVQALKQVIESIGVKTMHYTPQRIAQAISSAKNKLVTPEEYRPLTGRPITELVAQIYPAYQQRMLASSAVDFDDLLMHVAVMLFRNPELRTTLDARFRYVLVDEYQDTNRAQYVMLRGLNADHPNLAVTGDPDQSIYGWRGANIGNILEFETDFPQTRVVRLEQNFRSTKRILEVADQLIRHNVQRKQKALFTENETGAQVRLVTYPTGLDEAQQIAARIQAAIRSGSRRPRDFAIFFRVNALSRNLEAALREQGVPYQLVRAQEFFERKEIKDVLAYCQLLNNPRDDVALLRTINTPPRGIGKKTIERLAADAYVRGIPLLEAARQAGMVEGLSKRAAILVAKFVKIVDRLGEFADGHVEEIIGRILEETGYREYLREADEEDGRDRLANTEELLTDARVFDEEYPEGGGLEDYLERLWLVGDVDEWDRESEKVSLMTLHAAKGLEFPVVYLTALEQGLLPHERSCDNPAQLEEERRLLFVGVTRAQEELHVSNSARRDYRGERRSTIPSEFLMEMRTASMEIQTPHRFASDSLSAAQMAGIWDDETAELADEVEHDGFAQEGSQVCFGSEHLDGVDQVAEPDLQPGVETPPADPQLAKACTTAAALAGEAAAALEKADVSPDDFVLGMAVLHPDYGPGKIVAMSGAGRYRRAKVRFALTGEHSFVLRTRTCVRRVADDGG